MSNGETEKQLNNKMSSNWDKYVYTGIVCLNQIAFGLTINCFGPAFVDLKYIFHTSMDWISLIPSLMTFGYIVGSLFGFFYKYLNRQITLIVLTVLMSISTALVPYIQNIWVMYLSIWIYGLGAAAWTNASNVWLIEIWPQNSAPLLQVSNFMYGIGSILGPFIDKPYLTGEQDTKLNQTIISNSSEVIVHSLSTYGDIDRQSKLKTPFFINGMTQMIGPILMAVMFVIKRYEPSSETSKENPNKSITKLFESKEKPLKLMVTLSSIFLSFYCVSENNYLQFSATYFQYIPLKLTASKSAELFSAMALSYTIGRGIGVFISMKAKPQYIIIYHYLVLFIAITIISFGQNSLTLIWIGSLTLSYGFSSMYAAIYAFIGQYFEITNKIGTILTFFSGLINIVAPFILGRFIEKYSFVFIMSISINLSFSIFVFVFILYTVKKFSNNSELCYKI